MDLEVETNFIEDIDLSTTSFAFCNFETNIEKMFLLLDYLQKHVVFNLHLSTVHCQSLTYLICIMHQERIINTDQISGTADEEEEKKRRKRKRRVCVCVCVNIPKLLMIAIMNMMQIIFMKIRKTLRIIMIISTKTIICQVIGQKEQCRRISSIYDFL